MSRRIGFDVPPSSEITPKSVHMNRRAFLSTAGLFGLGAALAACSPKSTSTAGIAPTASSATDELGDPVSAFDAITHYNNYYEFSTNKEAVADLAVNFPTRPWTVKVGGLVNKPGTFAIETAHCPREADPAAVRRGLVDGHPWQVQAGQTARPDERWCGGVVDSTIFDRTPPGRVRSPVAYTEGCD
jgi:sulfoxide reductase catalytic subunit YedY